jgi:hypothetical protein
VVDVAVRPVDRRPARLSRAVAAIAGLLALVAGGFYSWLALGVGGIGVLSLGVGLVVGATAPVTLGAFALLLGGVLAGAGGAPVVTTLVAVTLAVVAGDVGATAVSVGRQLGRAADTTRLEAVHAGGSLAVGFLTAGVGYGLYRTGTGGRPVAALVFALVAVFFLVIALDTEG